jgi:methyl-accepting chemotaxis protein
MSKKRSSKGVTVVTKPSTTRWLQIAASALESLQANVLVANTDFEIVYINSSAKKTLGKIANEVQGAFGVDVEHIVGMSIHAFHRNARSVEKILTTPAALPHQTEFTFGNVVLEARINSIQGSAGEVLGYVVAWEDATHRQRLELDYAGQVAAIQRSQAVIEFALDSTILNANDIFLKSMGYSLEEVKGQRHGMFVEDRVRSSAEYSEFWARLNRGEFVAGEFRRVSKDGREVYIHGVYSPILDGNGKPFKIVKFATDVTQDRLRNADYEGQVAAIRRVQAVVEFDLDGVIINANDSFLQAMGYRHDEIQGRHHIPRC